MVSTRRDDINAGSSAGSGLLEVRLGCEFVYETMAGVAFVALVEPQPDGRQRRLRFARSATPDLPLHLYDDRFENTCWRLTAPGDRLAFRYDAAFTVPNAPDEADEDATEIPISRLPDDLLVFTLPSRYAQSDLLLDEAWQLFGAAPTGYTRVQAICDWVHTNVAYGYTASGPTKSAVDTYNAREGVCRDFAHLPVTFCRALNIPARYCFGYLPDYEVPPDPVPMDFHAWFEVYLAGPDGARWYTFDARHNKPRKGRVKVAHGRDAVDVAMATSYGQAQLASMTVWCDAAPLEPK
ncbi:MAG: transglutaminase-like domain-containing protein [Dehalococcoidia bacterium]